MTQRLVLGIAFLLSACGGGTVNGGGDGGNRDGAVFDARIIIDAFIPPNCVPGPTECTDCIDNDNDGLADGFDPECISAADNDEGSFATGIPGDNIDPNWQDCFFDGNSGSGNDGCRYHTCCLTGTCTTDDQRASCTPSAECIANCQAVTPPGCDCFGCCTICKDGVCYDVVTNPAIAPDCDYDVVEDPNLCPRCELSSGCGNPCDNQNCELCPGQTPDDLPPECQNVECLPGQTPCESTADCPVPDAGTAPYCSFGCCIDQVIVP